MKGEARTALDGENSFPILPADLLGGRGMAPLGPTSLASVRVHPWLAVPGLWLSYTS